MRALVRARRIAKGAIALTVLAALVVGIPWALSRYVGWPLPTSLPTWDEFTDALNRDGIPDETLIRALALVVWITWAALIASLVTETMATARGRTARRLPIAGTIQPILGRLVATIAIAVLAALPRNDDRAASAAPGTLVPHLRTHPPAALVIDPPTPPDNTPVTVVSDTPSTPTSVAMLTHTVVRGDTLWALAETHLGDPQRWPEIWELNADRTQPDGRTFTDPHWIYPGWQLQLPAEPAAYSPEPAATSLPAADPVVPIAPVAPVPAPSGAPQPEPASSAPPVASPMVEQGPTTSSTTPAVEAVPGASQDSGWLDLPSGARVGGGFAAGVAAAMALNRFRARRSYKPRPIQSWQAPTPDPPLAPALRAVLSTNSDNHTDEPPFPVPSPEVREDPAVIEVATRDDQVLTLGLTRWAGLSLAGPGAEPTARAWLSALITRAGPNAAEILMTEAVTDRLLPDLDFPSISIHTDIEQILQRLEAAIIARTRTCEDDDVADIVSQRRRYPEDPVPALLAVTDDPPPHLRARWDNAMACGTRLDISALTLTNQPPPGNGGGWLHIDDHATVTHAVPDTLDRQVRAARAFQLDLAEARTLLAPVAVAHHDPAPSRPDPSATAVRANGSTPPSDCTPPGPNPSEAGQDVGLAVLGPLRLDVHGQQIPKGLRSTSLELLAWYALHPNGATQEAAIDALWPDVDLDRGRQRFWSALGTARRIVRAATGDNTIEILTRAGDLYRLHKIAVDLWAFQHDLITATTNEPAEAVGALQHAATLYRDEFATGLDAIWAIEVREGLQRHALDALTRLASLHEQAGRTDAAIAPLEQAIQLDEYCEHAYRQLITLHAAQGRTDSAQRTWKILQGKLADLDVDPEPVTLAAVRHLADLPRRSRVRP